MDQSVQWSSRAALVSGGRSSRECISLFVYSFFYGNNINSIRKYGIDKWSNMYFVYVRVLEDRPWVCIVAMLDVVFFFFVSMRKRPTRCCYIGHLLYGYQNANKHGDSGVDWRSRYDMHEFEWSLLSAFQCRTVNCCACVARLKTSGSVAKYIGVSIVSTLYIPRQWLHLLEVVPGSSVYSTAYLGKFKADCIQSARYLALEKQSIWSTGQVCSYPIWKRAFHSLSSSCLE